MALFREFRVWPVNPEGIIVSALSAKTGRKFNSWKAW